jgi:integrase
MADAIAAGRTAGTFKRRERGKAVVSGGAATAARVVELLGGIWTWAERRGHVSGVNPVRGVEKHRPEPKERTLSPDELGALGEAVRGHSERYPVACAIIRLIALTGLRQGEAVMLRWGEIDPSGTCLHLSQSKTGRSTRPLGQLAYEHLKGVSHRPSGYVFGMHEQKKTLAKVFDAAGLPDARSHDLRRTFASTAAELGYGDATIAEGPARRY